MKVGLTGGIASGKSTAAGWMRAWGAEVIDSDQLAHEAITPGGEAYQEVVGQFGAGIVNPDGTIHRQRLGEIVFNDAAARERLNQIVHPKVRAQWQKRASEAEARSDRAMVVAMIPLLYETNAETAFQSVVVVGCREETQVARLCARGLSPGQIQARLRAQWPIPLKMERAEFVIWNEYSSDILEQQTRMIWQELCKDGNPRRN